MINVAIHNSPCCSQQWQKPEDPPLCCASWIELQIMADRGLPIETNVFFKTCNGHMMNWTNSFLVSHTFRLLTHLKENLHFLDFHLPLPQLFLPGALAVFVGVSGRSVLVPLSTLTASSWRIKKKEKKCKLCRVYSLHLCNSYPGYWIWIQTIEEISGRNSLCSASSFYFEMHCHKVNFSLDIF